MLILNLGAGVQSTTLFLWAADGRIKIDHAIFADTQDEPAPVYQHLEWLKTQGGPPITTLTVGRLGDHFVHGGGRTRRSASIPAFFWDGSKRYANGKPAPSINDRVCSQEYKARPIRTFVARELLGITKGRRVGRRMGVEVKAFYGISTDEAARAGRIKSSDSVAHWWHPVFPLIEAGWSRKDCHRYLADRVPYEVPRSCCVFCPYRNKADWLWLKDNDPAGWQRAVDLDRELRQTPNSANSGKRGQMFLHKQCVPLDVVRFDEQPSDQLDLFSAAECVGMCGV